MYDLHSFLVLTDRRSFVKCEENMKRIVKDPVVRRNEILDAAERLMATKGYEQMEQLIIPILADPTLSALEKLLRYFSALDQWKGAHRSFVLTFTRFWYADENAI